MTTYSLNKPNYFLFQDFSSEVKNLAVHILNTNCLAASNGCDVTTTAHVIYYA